MKKHFFSLLSVLFLIGFVCAQPPQGGMSGEGGMRGGFGGRHEGGPGRQGRGPEGSGGPNMRMVSIQPNFNNVAYATVSEAQKLDIYQPKKIKKSCPVVVYIHGGAFKFGDRAGIMDQISIKKMVDAGFIVASINYRLSGEALYPAQIQDVKAAIRFLRANSEKYKINPEQVISWGGSAGGCLSALAATTGGVAELEGAELGNTSFSSRVVAAIDWYGPIDFLSMEEQAQKQGLNIRTNDANSPESKLIGGAVQDNAVKCAKTNAMNYITPDDAALYIQYGTNDKNIPVMQHHNFYKALLPVLGAEKVKLDAIEGAGHGGKEFDADENMAKLIAFLKKQVNFDN
jgi:acetyl esterase/lipase